MLSYLLYRAKVALARPSITRQQLEFLMSATTDLQAAVAALTTKVDALIAAYNAAASSAAANAGAVATSDADAAVTALNTLATSVGAALPPTVEPAPAA